MRTAAADRIGLIFSLLDADGTGHLEAADFELMANRVVLAAPESEEREKRAMTAAFRRYWTTLAAELDTDGDNRISFDEYAACVLSPQRFDSTARDFAEALAALGDPDGDGLVERHVFVALMSAIGFDRGNIHSLFDAFEPTPGDQITVTAWIAGIEDYYRPDKTGIPGDHLVGAASA